VKKRKGRKMNWDWEIVIIFTIAISITSLLVLIPNWYIEKMSEEQDRKKWEKKNIGNMGKEYGKIKEWRRK